ncbi:hypothetical protein J6590_029640 [Homalodisca vitripennis]|nr:hypothetical protein J6590_029640 [Homalodisca vitripennis]
MIHLQRLQSTVKLPLKEVVKTELEHKLLLKLTKARLTLSNTWHSALHCAEIAAVVNPLGDFNISVETTSPLPHTLLHK